MINPAKLLELNRMKNAFEQRHPRIFPFLTAISKDGLREGSIIEMNVKTPEGKNYCANMKVTREDLELFQELKKMRP